MKRMQKNVLGFSGLALVAGMTMFAALMPSPEASATSSSVTDTLVVKVIEDKPTVSLTSTTDEITEPSYTYNLSYNHTGSIVVTLTYTDMNGHTYDSIVIYSNENADYGYVDLQNQVIDLTKITFPVDVPASYGVYKLEAKTIASDGTPYFDVLTFEYTPVAGGIVEDDKGNVSVWVPKVTDGVNLIIVRTEDGKVVGSVEGDFSTDSAYANGFSIPLNLSGIDCQEKLYLDAYRVTRENGEESKELVYTKVLPFAESCPVVPNTGVPDTGGLLQDLNISKEDYLITGLIVFFVLGIVGFGVVARNRAK